MRLFLFGYVACHFGESKEVVIVVFDAVDDDGRPELCAVLAYTPAFGFETAFCSCLGERTRRYAGITIFLGVENAEVLSDDFFRRITLDVLGPGIPGGDVARRIELEDRIIDDRFDQLPITAFTL